MAVSIDTAIPVAAIGGTTTAASASAAAAKTANMNYDSFLKLLITQMKNQDPTDPMDASQQVSQLATFSQVEQAIKTNSNLESLIQAQSMSQATSYLGKTITSSDGGSTGVISEIRITSTGLSAITTNGNEIAIESGITIKG